MSSKNKSKCSCKSKCDKVCKKFCVEYYPRLPPPPKHCPCPPDCKVLLHINFAQDGFDPDEFPITFGDDGTTSTSFEGLKVDSSVFTATTPFGNEHPKWLHYYKDAFSLPSNGELIYEGLMTATQKITLAQVPPILLPRIRNIKEDIRLCSAGLNVIDQQTWVVADFFISDQALYAFYERLPLGRSAQTNYAAYSNCIRVASRTADPDNDFQRLAIGINKSEDYIKWYIGGKEVLRIDNIGCRLSDQYRMLDHGGPAQRVASQMQSINVGFGTFSLMDMALPNNYGRDYVQGDSIAISQLVQLELVPAPPGYYTGYAQLYEGASGAERPLLNASPTFAVVANQFPDNNKEIKLFGQGDVLKVNSIRVLECKEGCYE